MGDKFNHAVAPLIAQCQSGNPVVMKAQLTELADAVEALLTSLEAKIATL